MKKTKTSNFVPPKYSRGQKVVVKATGNVGIVTRITYDIVTWYEIKGKFYNEHELEGI
jgi:hypothetical protein